MFCIAEVPSSVLSLETGSSDSGFCCLSEFLKADAAILRQIRARHLSATCFVIVHPLIISTFSNIQYKLLTSSFCLFLAQQPPSGARAFSFTRFLDHPQRHTTFGRTPLHDWSARRRDLYLTTHNSHNRQTTMPPVGFEPTISTRERPQTCVLDPTATGTDYVIIK